MQSIDLRWLGALLLCGCGLAQALESDAGQPIYMEADGVEIDERSGASIYRGNVLLTQGTIRITAEKVRVVQTGDNRQGRVEASGNPVTFRQQTDEAGKVVKGRARRIEYDTDSEVLVMIGEAMLEQNRDTFASDRIVYDRARSVVKAGSSASGKQRVRMTIQAPGGDNATKSGS